MAYFLQIIAIEPLHSNIVTLKSPVAVFPHLLHSRGTVVVEIQTTQD